MSSELMDCAHRRTQQLRLAKLADRATEGDARALDGFLLDVEIWHESRGYGCEVRCCLAVGGPTEWVFVHLGTEAVRYSHSAHGETYLPRVLADAWLATAADFAEVMA